VSNTQVQIGKPPQGTDQKVDARPITTSRDRPSRVLRASRRDVRRQLGMVATYLRSNTSERARIAG
jgi:hypothetical protein